MLAQSSMACIFLTQEWQNVWWDNLAGLGEMAGFAVSNGGEVVAIASLAQHDDTLGFVGSTDTCDYNDFLVRPGFEEVFYPALLDVLDVRDWSLVRLDSLRADSPTLAHLPQLARERGYVVEVEYEDVTSGLALPNDWDQFLALLTKKNRHELRRKLRRLDTQTDWNWYCLTTPEAVDENFDRFLALMRGSSPEKAEFMTPEREKFFRALTYRMAELDRLRLFFMELDGAMAASSLCFDYGSSRLLYNSGYDPELAYFSVGLLLHAMCVKDAVCQGIKYFDYLRGPEPYKAHLGGRQSNLYRLTMRRN